MDAFLTLGIERAQTDVDAQFNDSRRVGFCGHSFCFFDVVLFSFTTNAS